MFETFLEVQEDLLLRILDIVEASGTDFAFPFPEQMIELLAALVMGKDEGTRKWRRIIKGGLR